MSFSPWALRYTPSEGGFQRTTTWYLLPGIWRTWTCITSSYQWTVKGGHEMAGYLKMAEGGEMKLHDIGVKQESLSKFCGLNANSTVLIQAKSSWETVCSRGCLKGDLHPRRDESQEIKVWGGNHNQPIQKRVTHLRQPNDRVGLQKESRRSGKERINS